MKTLRPTLLGLCLTLASIQNAGAMGPNTLTGPMSFIEVMNEVAIMRPFGLLATLLGTTFFVGTLPLTGLAAIAEPHDAVRKAGDALVVAPAAFTFSRPFGVYRYDPKGNYPQRRSN